jgi:hypothetical protein
MPNHTATGNVRTPCRPGEIGSWILHGACSHSSSLCPHSGGSESWQTTGRALAAAPL